MGIKSKNYYAIPVFLCLIQSLACAADWGYDFTPLMEAAQKGNVKKMILLIEQGEDVNAVYERDFPRAGKPVLRYAIDAQSLAAVQLLLKSGANPNDFTASPIMTKDSNANVRNISLLAHAVRIKASLAIAQELVKYGADIEGTPKIAGDWTVLMIAAYVGNVKAVKYLLSVGANKHAVNSYDGKTALDYAREQGHKEIVKLLNSSI